MRKLFKWLLTIGYWSSIVVSITWGFITVTNQETHRILIPIGCSVVSFFFFLFLQQSDVLNGTKLSGSRWFPFAPRLGKAVYHGYLNNIFISYDKSADNYNLYQDKLFYKTYIGCIYSSRVGSETSLAKEAAALLDNKYKSLISEREREERVRIEKRDNAIAKQTILNKWDGYTSVESKRDKLIDDII